MQAKTKKPSSGKPAVLLTGIAGFIGFHCARRLLAEGQHKSFADLGELICLSFKE
jgi:thioester reductase-like protein